MHEFESFIKLVEGDKDPVLGVTIKEVVFKDTNFIVYLGSKDDIYWSTLGYEKFSDDFGLVMNKVRELELLNESIFKGKELNRYNYFVAEGVARLLDDHNSTNAMKILDEARREITVQGKNKNRITYILSSIIFTLVIALFIFLLFTFRHFIIESLNQNAYEILISSLFGGIGAFISAFFRSNTYEPDIFLRKRIHILDGLLRNFYGCIAGLLIVLGIKSNLIFGFLNNTDKSLIVISFLCFIGGASESLIPSLINQVEGKGNK